MSDPYVGQICLFAFNFAPVGWQLCNGALLPVSEYETLFTLLGTTYGGDGVNTFAVPDLRGRLPIGMGTSTQGNNYQIGQSGGQETVTVTTNQMPSHTHTVAANNVAATSPTPSSTSIIGALQATTGATSMLFTSAAGAANTTLAAATVGNQGGSIPVSIIQPILAANYCISLFGIFPTQA
jgi:microcystin-dependent protein